MKHDDFQTFSKYVKGGSFDPNKDQIHKLCLCFRGFCYIFNDMVKLLFNTEQFQMNRLILK